MYKTKLFTSILVCLLIAGSSFAQYNPVMITLDTNLTNVQASKSFYIKNTTNKLLQITSIRSINTNFSFPVNQININPFDSVLITVNFRTNQNITYRDFLIFENKTLNYSIVNYVTATSKYPDALYSFTQGLKDEPLKTALRTFVTTGYITLGYNTARDKMFETVDDYGNDTIECVYIGRRIKAVNRTEAQNQGFNTEHTWPQSFFGSADPMVSDLNHLFPTDNLPNNARGNYDFGIVYSDITYSDGGSKLGKDFEGQIVFEPRNVHKGNVARSMFYFGVRYGNPGTFMDAKQDNVLRQWDKFDTVNANERLRNNRVKTFQNNRNPFADHPELIDRIKSTYSTITDTPLPKISASPFNVRYDTLASNDTASYYLALMNYGNATLNINSVTSSSPQFNVVSYPSTIPQNELRYARIKFRPNSTNQTFNATLTITNSDSTIIVNLQGFSNSNTGIVNISSEIPKEFGLSQNYPNPFNPSTSIRFQVAKAGFMTIKVYDITGKEVSTPVNEYMAAGNYEVKFDAGNNISSGVYYYKMYSGNFSDVKRMMLVR